MIELTPKVFNNALQDAFNAGAECKAQDINDEIVKHIEQTGKPMTLLNVHGILYFWNGSKFVTLKSLEAN